LPRNPRRRSTRLSPVRGDHDGVHSPGPSTIGVRRRTVRIRDPRSTRTTQEYGRSTAWRTMRRHATALAVLPSEAHQGLDAPSAGRNRRPAVDKPKGRSLYTRSTVRRPPRRDGAPTKPSLRCFSSQLPIPIGSAGFDGAPGLRRMGPPRSWAV